MQPLIAKQGGRKDVFALDPEKWQKDVLVMSGLGRPLLWRLRMFGTNSFKTLLAAGALALMAGGASAATVLTVDDTVPAISPIQGTITCIMSCEGYVGAVPAWSTTNAIMFTSGNSDAAELATVNMLTGESFASGSKTNLGDSDNDEDFTFFSNALYILFKIGGQNPSHFLIKNTAPGEISVNWLKGDDKGTGLSHYNEFGVAAVPLPAAGFLLIGALGGLAALRRRRRAA